MEVIKINIFISIIIVILLLLLYLYYIDTKINNKFNENKNILVNNSELQFNEEVYKDKNKNNKKFVTKKSFNKNSNNLNLCIDGTFAVFNEKKNFDNKLCYCNYDNLCLTSNDIGILRNI